MFRKVSGEILEIFALAWISMEDGLAQLGGATVIVMAKIVIFEIFEAEATMIGREESTLAKMGTGDTRIIRSGRILNPRNRASIFNIGTCSATDGDDNRLLECPFGAGR